MTTETLTLINGNNQPYNVGLPKLEYIGYINPVALAHVFDNTGLNFQPNNAGTGYQAQPHSSQQIVKLLLTYNFKTQYYNNWDYKNTLFLKSDNHVGYQVDSICFDCCKENHINTNGLKPGDRLAC